jgi:hypothetical protein
MQNAASGRTRVRCRAVFTERAPSQPDCVSSVTFDPDTIHDGRTTAFAGLEQLVMVVCVEEVFSLFEHETARTPFPPLARATPCWSVSIL